MVASNAIVQSRCKTARMSVPVPGSPEPLDVVKGLKKCVIVFDGRVFSFDEILKPANRIGCCFLDSMDVLREQKKSGRGGSTWPSVDESPLSSWNSGRGCLC